MNGIFPMLAATVAWSSADLLYKIGGWDPRERFTSAKIAVWAGLVMAAVFCLLRPFSESGDPFAVIAAHPVFCLFLLAFAGMMLVTNVGLKHLDMSVMSPLENVGVAIPPVCLAVWYAMNGRFAESADSLGPLGFAAILCVAGGVMALPVAIRRTEKSRRDVKPSAGTAVRRRMPVLLALLFPLAYAVFDSFETVIIAVGIDERDGAGIGDYDMILIHTVAFAAVGVACWVWMAAKGVFYVPFRKSELPKAGAVACEASADIAYVSAISASPIAAGPVTSAYCALTIVLSHALLRERPGRGVIACVAFVCVGIFLFALSEVFQ